MNRPFYVIAALALTALPAHAFQITTSHKLPSQATSLQQVQNYVDHHVDAWDCLDRNQTVEAQVMIGQVRRYLSAQMFDARTDDAHEIIQQKIGDLDMAEILLRQAENRCEKARN